MNNLSTIKHAVSYYTVIGVAILYLLTGSLYYPKFEQQGTEAVISWDVAGYYMYLPHLFIHRDLQSLSKAESLRAKHKYSPHSDQYYSAGENRVLKYSAGMAVYYLPAFALGHLTATIGPWEADGYTQPYQFFLWLQGILVLVIGLVFLRKFLLAYASDGAVALALIFIALGTNLLEYGALTNAMSHVYLFTSYSILLWILHRGPERVSIKLWILTALIIGLMALARPTEIVALSLVFLFILFYPGLRFISFIKKKVPHIILFVITLFLIASIQAIYWNHVSGRLFQYSYQNQGFSWLEPHLIEGLISGKAGWLTYTPLALVGLVGIVFLKKEAGHWKIPMLLFIGVFAYIAFAWDIWWYGGSVGQRTMISVYPMLALGLASMVDRVSSALGMAVLSVVLSICGIYNVWLIHQAHDGALLKPGEMTAPYLRAIAFKKSVDPEFAKLLDSRYVHTEKIESEKELFIKDERICLDEAVQFTPIYKISLRPDAKIIRLYTIFEMDQIETEQWRWTQAVLRFKKGDEMIKTDILRLQRTCRNVGRNNCHLDARVPAKCTEVDVLYWHAGSSIPLCINQIKLTALQ